MGEEVATDKGLTASPPDPRRKTVRDEDVQEYLQLIVQTGDTIKNIDAARILGVDRSTLYKWRGLEGFKEAVQKALENKHLPRFPKILEAIETKAATGDVRCAEFLRDTIGMNPPEELDRAAAVKEWPSIFLRVAAEHGLENVVVVCRAIERYNLRAVVAVFDAISEHGLEAILQAVRACNNGGDEAPIIDAEVVEDTNEKELT